MALFFGDDGLNGIIEVLLPFIILYMVYNAFFPNGLGGMGGFVNEALIHQRRLKNQVKNDGTDRDYLSLIRSCKAYPGYAKVLWSDTSGDRDIRSARMGKIIGISSRLTFTAILYRPKWYSRAIMLMCPNDMLTTLDRPVIQIKTRGPVNFSEHFWFPEPLRSSKWGKDDNKLHEYWNDICYQMINEISLKRISIDCEGDKDFQLKCSQRNNPDDAKDEIGNELKRSRSDKETEGLNE